MPHHITSNLSLIYSCTPIAFTNPNAAPAARPPTIIVLVAPYKYPPHPPVAPLPISSVIHQSSARTLDHPREVRLESTKDEQDDASDDTRDDQSSFSIGRDHVWDERDKTADEV